MMAFIGDRLGYERGPVPPFVEVFAVVAAVAIVLRWLLAKRKP